MDARYHLSPNPTGPDHDRKFSEPRTVPGGWDIDPLKQSLEMLPAELPAASTEQPTTNECPDNGAQENSQSSLPEKFGELRTIPTGWDTSEFR